MKVLFNPMISNQKIVKSTKNSKAETPVENPNKGEETAELKKFNGYITNINFRAKSKIVSITNQKLAAEIKSLEAQKKTLMETVVPEAVKEAKYKLERLKWWNSGGESDTWRNARKKAADEAEKAKSQTQKRDSAFERFFTNSGNKAYDSKFSNVMDSEYYSKLREFNDISAKKSVYEELVAVGEKSVSERRDRIRELEEMIATKAKMIDYQSLQDEINNMLAAVGGVEDRIAGYEDEKNKIITDFIEPLLRSKHDPSVILPSAVLLYGPTGTGKTTFLRGIEDQAATVAHVIDLSALKKSPTFDDMLQKELDKASQRYIKENKRTVLILNDAEDIFTISEKDAPLLGVTLDEQDKTVIRAAGDNTYERISNFKQLLDTISQTPKTGVEGGRHATTIFTATNYPHLIHPDLLSREGKMTKIAIGLAKEKDLIDVLQFYFEKMEIVAESLRALKNKSDYESYIDGISNISKKARGNIKNLIRTGKIDKLHVDYNHMPYAKLAEVMAPSTKTGAYSNDCIRVICQDAFKDYLEQDPSVYDYRDSFFKVFKNTKRDLNPQRLKKFNLIDRMIQNEKVEIDELDAVLEQIKTGLGSEKTENLFKYYQNSNKIQLESLLEREEKFGLTEEEKQKKEELLAIKKKIDDVIAGVDDVEEEVDRFDF